MLANLTHFYINKTCDFVMANFNIFVTSKFITLKLISIAYQIK